MELHWTCLALQDMRPETLYEMLSLRQQVFVLEQRCFYLDTDGLDLQVLHLLGRAPDGRLAAYARLIPPGLKGAGQPLPAISRVLSAPWARGQGQGRALVAQALLACEQHWPGQGQQLSAQAHLQAFYAGFGFMPVSPVYDEDGIPHIDMERRPQQGAAR